MRHLVIAIAMFIALIAILVGIRGMSQAHADEAKIDALNASVKTLGSQVASLSDDVTKLQATLTATPATTPAAVDDAKLKELIQAQLQAMNIGRGRNGPGGGGGGGGGFGDPTQIQRRLQDQLGLEEAKAVQVSALLQAEMTEMRTLFQSGASREEIQAKMKDEKTALEAKTAAILSTDEQTKFTNWLDEREAMFNRGNRRQNPGGGPPGGPGGQPGGPGGQPGAPGGQPGAAPTAETKPNSF